MIRCFICDRRITGRSPDVKVCLTFDKGEGKVASVVVCSGCQPLPPPRFPVVLRRRAHA